MCHWHSNYAVVITSTVPIAQILESNGLQGWSFFHFIMHFIPKVLDIYLVGHTNDVNVCNNCYSSRAGFCALFWCQIMLNEHYLIMAKSIDGGGQKSILLTGFPILQAHSVTVCVCVCTALQTTIHSWQSFFRRDL